MRFLLGCWVAFWADLLGLPLLGQASRLVAGAAR